MKKYEVIVDYVMTATIVVEARDEESADRKAWRYVHSRKGFDEYIRFAAPRNVLLGYKDVAWCVDGFDSPENASEYDGDGEGVIDLTKEG